jgi:hydroxypyruvate reductase
MCQGALDHLPPCDALVVTKYEHADADIRSRDRVEVIESAHPVPDQQSSEAGNAMLDRIRSLPEGARHCCWFLGGASAFAEAPPEGTSLEELQSVTDEMIAGGKTIAQINARRKHTSLIKDGKLTEHFGGSGMRLYAISDV